MPRKAKLWWSGIKVDSPLNPSLEGGPANFEMNPPTYNDLVKIGEDQNLKGEGAPILVTLVGEIRTRKNLVIVRAPYWKGNVMGNGYGESGAFPAMLVVKTFRDARVLEGAK
jgi:hypothetical protein